MAVLLGTLRLLLPLILIAVFLIAFMRRSKRSGQQSNRIDVDAKVVSSEQKKVNLEDFEPSEVSVEVLHKPPSDQETHQDKE